MTELTWEPTMQSHTKENAAQPAVLAQCARATRLTDPRMVYRLDRILQSMSKAPGQSIPQISADWAESKAAYRFLGF